MKFSHALKFNANSAWKDHYINYNRLKKLIYRKEAEETKGLSLNFPDVANRTSIGTALQLILLVHVPSDKVHAGDALVASAPFSAKARSASHCGVRPSSQCSLLSLSNAQSC